MTDKEKLKVNVWSSATWKDDLEENEPFADAMEQLIDSLDDEQAKALLSLDNYQEQVRVKTANVPTFEKTQDKTHPIKVMPGEDFGEIVYTCQPIRIADILVQICIGSLNISEKTTDKREPIKAYWKQLANVIPSISSKRPEKYPVPTTAVAQKLRNLSTNEIKKKGFAATVEQKATQKRKTVNISTPVKFMYGGKEEVLPIKPISYSISSAIDGLIKSGIRQFSPGMIWREMCGWDDYRSITKQQEATVVNAVEGMRQIVGEIDATQEAKHYGKDLQYGGINQNMLSLTGAKAVLINGQCVRAWECQYNNRGEPLRPLLAVHAEISGQIMNVPFAALNVKCISMTEKNVVLRDALLVQLHRIANRKSGRILFDQFYVLDGITAKTKSAKTRKDRIQKKIIAMLTFWKDQGYIRDFAKDTAGVNVEMDPQKELTGGVDP